MKKKILFLGVIAVIAGVLLIFFEPLTDWRINNLSHSVIETTETFEAKSIDTDTHYNFDEVKELSFDSLLTLPKAEDVVGIGTLIMPEVDMTIPILNGLSDENLMAGAGTMKKDQQPGQGNYAIAGHNWRDRTTLFSPLHRAQEGMSIFLRIGDDTFEYRVTTIQTVEPTRIDMIEDQNEPLLTLVTCNYDGTERLIVQATLV
ncbi:class A sortase [Alkalibacterium kapii]|uniref:Class A sortase n=1 Tax=Alkalibacterium kapii TaxID=426704 RepID=A0A511AUY3_9LACT|nr:class A sortase [Alkalibacterium kapii]GEK92010.1 class A sortase [Alkalibacterium kapii]